MACGNLDPPTPAFTQPVRPHPPPFSSPFQPVVGGRAAVELPLPPSSPTGATPASWRGPTLGGGLRSAIYRNLPQFYPNFSVMLLFKNFNFSLRKNLSLSLLSLGTLYVSVFSSVLDIICVAGRFSVFVSPKCHLLLGTVILARAKGQ